jgi:DNA-binding NarL/FixJ family response regulator
VLKDITAEQLATAIRVVAQGQVLLHPEVAQKVFAAFSSAPIESTVSSPAPSAFDGVSNVEQLTEREREILALLAQGIGKKWNRSISRKRASKRLRRRNFTLEARIRESATRA